MVKSDIFIQNLLEGKSDDRIVFFYILRLPFDWKNPYGYVGAFIVEYITGIYVLGTMLTQTSLIIGSYWLLISLAKDISRGLYGINETKLKPLQLERDLINFMKLQSNAKRLGKHLLL